MENEVRRSISLLLVVGFLAALGGYGVLEQLRHAPNMTLAFLSTVIFAGGLAAATMGIFLRAMKMIYANERPSTVQWIFGSIGVFIAGCECFVVALYFFLFALVMFTSGIL